MEVILGLYGRQTPPPFLSSPPSFPEEMKESGGKKD